MTATTLFVALTIADGAPLSMWAPGGVVPSPDVQATATELLVDHTGPDRIPLPGPAATAFMTKVRRLRVLADGPALVDACGPGAGLVGLVRALPGLRRVDLVARDASPGPDPCPLLRLALGTGTPVVVGPISADDEGKRESQRLELRLVALAMALARCRRASVETPCAKRQRS